MPVEVRVEAKFASLVDTEPIIAAVQAALSAHAANDAVVTVIITTNRAVQALNHQYRNVDAPTDVLSFAGDAEPGHSLPPGLRTELGANLGDLLIAYPYAACQAAKYGNSVAAELRLLAVHGTLHLLGFDHDTRAEEERMWAAQRHILTQFGDAVLVDRIYE